MHSFAQQTRVAIRSLLRAPGFAMGAMLTLALGIGLSTAVFTIADAVLLRRLPVADQDRLILLWGETRDGRFSNFPLALSDVREFERRSRSLDGVAFFAFRGASPTSIQTDDRVYPIQLALVSGNFFDVLKSTPAIGRALRPEDDVAGAAPVVVLTHRAWQQRFGGDTAIVGRSISMIYGGKSYTIVGVMPQGLEYPRGTDVWAPLIAYGAAGGFLDVVSGELDILARLRPGATGAQARGELTSFFTRSDAPAWHRDVRGVVHAFSDVVLGETKPALLLVTVAAALLLFITCVNVANLLLVRALARVREFTVRAALGASRGRIVAQLLIESGVLALAGGLLGAALAIVAVRMFVALAPSTVPRIDEIGVNAVTLVGSILTTTIALLVSGLGPALFTSRVRAQEVLRGGSWNTGGRRVRSVAQVLVVAQIALAVVSLTAAALVTRSLINLQRVDLSFEPGQLLVVPLAMRPDQLSDKQKQQAALDVVLTGTEAVAGVRDVTPVYAAPFIGAGGGIDGRLSRPGQSAEEAAAGPMLNLEVAAPNYFAMLGIPMLRGRAFSDEDRDGAPPVIVVSVSVARHFWPDAEAIGKQLAMPGRVFTVVGVVPDTRYRELRTARPTVYFPLRQSVLPTPSTLLIRTTGSPAQVVPSLRHVIADAHAGVTVVSASSLETLLDAPSAQPRLNVTVLALFAIAALTLSAIGLFAIIATMVRQRIHELGIRMALGATAGDVRRMIMGHGLSLAVVGAAIGIAGALAMNRLLSALLFEISSTDAATIVSVALLMLSVAAVASFLPARAGSRTDPVVALRSEA
jgi:putative ABC transport system permease protein